MGVPPIAGWFLVENPDLKWMMTGDIPYFRKPPYNMMIWGIYLPKPGKIWVLWVLIPKSEL